MGAARVGEAIHVDVVEPVSEREFDVRLADAAFQQHRAVNVNFSMHCLPRNTDASPGKPGLQPFPVIVWTGNGIIPLRYVQGPEMSASSDTANMALFCDFENVALGVRDAKYAKFDINKVLERLLLKGASF